MNLAANLSANQVVCLSSEGSDKGDGTLSAPYYSLNKAVEGRLDGYGPTDTLFIEVAPGYYYMERPFVIDHPSSRPIVIRSTVSGKKPCFVGGMPVQGWEPCGDNLYRAYLPEVTRYGLDFEQFYVNGKRAVHARTPNTGWYFVQDVTETSLVPGVRFADYAVQRVNFKPDDWQSMRIQKSADLQHMKFRFIHKWDNTHKYAAYVNTDSACIYISGKGLLPWNKLQKKTRYIMYDYQAALDTVGEWYLDREEGYLYYMPREGEDMKTARCFVPTLPELVRFKGKAGRPVEHVIFEGISFQYASYRVPKEQGEDPTQSAVFIGAALSFDFSERISLIDCEVLHTGAYGICFGQECHYNKVQHCYLADLGGGGIKIGEACFRTDNRPVTSHQMIDNNIITHGGRQFPCASGIIILHSSDNQVTHNEISDLYYTGVSVGWVWGYNNSDSPEFWTHHFNAKGEEEFYQAKIMSPTVRNIISYNHIHHLGWAVMSDIGGVYTLGESTGTQVNNNVIHDIVSYSYGGWGLYTDQGSSRIEMKNNLVYRCKSGSYHHHFGKENRIENNIFAFSVQHQVEYTRPEPHSSFSFKHNIILQDRGETLSGPWLEGRMEVDSNLYWSLKGGLLFSEKYTFKEWKKLKEPHSINTDPLFKNPLADDYSLMSRRAVRKIGFQPFDYSEAGVYGDEAWIEKAKLDRQVIEDFKIKTAPRLNKL